MEQHDSVSIKINGVEYALNKSGVNLVVYDKIYKRVVDSVCLTLEEAYLDR